MIPQKLIIELANIGIACPDTLTKLAVALLITRIKNGEFDA